MSDVAARIVAAAGDPTLLLHLVIELAQENARLAAQAEVLEARKANGRERSRRWRSSNPTSSPSIEERHVTSRDVTERDVTSPVSQPPSPLPSSSSSPTPLITTPPFPPSPKITLADENFERAWAKYPARLGGNSKADALKAWQARRKKGVDPEAIIAGIERYAAFCEAVGKTGTQFVMQAATFFGPSQHWVEAYDTAGARRGEKMRMVFDDKGWYSDVPA